MAEFVIQQQIIGDWNIFQILIQVFTMIYHQMVKSVIGDTMMTI